MEGQLTELIKNYIFHTLKTQKIRTRKGFEKKYKILGNTFSKDQKESIKTTLETMVDTTFSLGEEFNPLIKKIINESVR